MLFAFDNFQFKIKYQSQLADSYVKLEPEDSDTPEIIPLDDLSANVKIEIDEEPSQYDVSEKSSEKSFIEKSEPHDVDLAHLICNSTESKVASVIFDAYKIPNLENKGKEVGTTNQPYFYQITSGQRHGESLIYHSQIGKKYYGYRMNSCSSEKVVLRCRHKSCKAVALCKIPKSSSLIIVKPTKRSNGKRMVNQYTLKFGDLRLRDLSEYIFLPKNSPEHTCQGQLITTGAQLDFREAHCNQGLLSEKIESENILQKSNLISEYGIETAASIAGKKKTERQRFYRRLSRMRERTQVDTSDVSPEH